MTIMEEYGQELTADLLEAVAGEAGGTSIRKWIFPLVGDTFDLQNNE